MPRSALGYPQAPFATPRALRGRHHARGAAGGAPHKGGVLYPHALQGGVKFMVTFGLGESSQTLLLLGLVVALAHGLLLSLEALRSSYAIHRGAQRDCLKNS